MYQRAKLVHCMDLQTHLLCFGHPRRITKGSTTPGHLRYTHVERRRQVSNRSWPQQGRHHPLQVGGLGQPWWLAGEKKNRFFLLFSSILSIIFFSTVLKHRSQPTSPRSLSSHALVCQRSLYVTTGMGPSASSSISSSRCFIVSHSPASTSNATGNCGLPTNVIGHSPPT